MALLFEIYGWRNNSRTLYEFHAYSWPPLWIQRNYIYFWIPLLLIFAQQINVDFLKPDKKLWEEWEVPQPYDFGILKQCLTNVSAHTLQKHRHFQSLILPSAPPVMKVVSQIFMCFPDLLEFLYERRNTSTATSTSPQIFNLKWIIWKTNEKAGCLDLKCWNDVFLGSLCHSAG